MKLHYSPTSPYARKVRVLAAELGLDSALSLRPVTLSPIAPDAEVNASNPLGKVPALVLDDGETLYDSRVISEYLLSRGAGASLLPAAGAPRWAVLRR